MRIPVLFFSLLVCASAVAQSPCAGYSFDAPRVYWPARDLNDTIVADFDGDGRLDFGTNLFFSPNRFLLRFQEASGRFSEPQEIDASISRVGDVVGDPLPDLLTNGQVLENLGGRRFAAPMQVPPGFSVTGDFTGDGHSDLLIVSAANGVLLMRRTAAGGLEEGARSSLGDIYPYAIVQGDFDGDGLIDLAAPSSSGAAVRIFRNAGDGSFTPGVVHAPSVGSQLIEAADLDRDGRSDLLVVNDPLSPGVRIDVFYANGRKETFWAYGRLQRPRRVLVDDLNGDGAPEVMITATSRAQSLLFTFLNDGSGTLLPAGTMDIAYVHDVASGDLTGDGHIDLLLPRIFGMEVLPGRGTGEFAVPRSLAGVQGKPHAVQDFDHDGLDELVFFEIDRITVLWNDGHGGYRSETLRRSFIHDLETSDDGLAAFDSFNQVLYVITRENGTWRERTVPVAAIGFPTMYAIDINRDGSSEVVTVDHTTASTQISVTSGSENRLSFSLPVRTSNRSVNVAFGEMNGDGLMDMVVAFSGTLDPAQAWPTPLRDGSIAIFAGTSAGGFTRLPDALTGAAPWWLATGDFNGDGRRDIVTVTMDSIVLAIYGSPAGFTAPQVLEDTRRGDIRPTTGDFDGDGRTDLVVSSGDSFVNFRGTSAGLVEDGRFSAGKNGFPTVVRLRANAPPSLMFTTGPQPLIVDANCTPAGTRRRSVR